MRSLPLSLSLPLTLTLSLTLSAGCIRRGPSWAGLSDDAWSRRSDLAGALRYELPTDAHKLAYVTSFAGHDDHVDGAWRSVDSGGVFHGPVVLVTEAHSLRDVTLPAVDDAVLAGERAAVAELGGAAPRGSNGSPQSPSAGCRATRPRRSCTSPCTCT